MSGVVKLWKPTKTLRAKAGFMKVLADILALAEHLVHLLFFLTTSKKYVAVKKKERMREENQHFSSQFTDFHLGINRTALQHAQNN